MSHRYRVRSRRWARLSASLAASLMIVGCTSLGPEEAFDEVSANVLARTGNSIVWPQTPEDDEELQQGIDVLLARPLTPAIAVQVALVNNPQLRARYAELGIAQAALVQAGLLKNPVFDGAVTWFGDAGGTPNLAFGVAWRFIDIFNRPLRQAVAASEFEEAKVKLAADVISLAAETHLAFVDYVAFRQEERLISDILRSSNASLAAAVALRQAGNITELQVEEQRGLVTKTQLEASQAAPRLLAAREKLAVLTGIQNASAFQRISSDLPPLPATLPDTRSAENRGVSRNLDVELARQKLVTLGEHYRLVKRTALLPDFESGAEYEREVEVEEDDKKLRNALGPTFEVEIPIFDRGEARMAGAYFKIQKAEHNLRDTISRVRSGARLAVAELKAARTMAAMIKSKALPQSSRLLDETQRGYNAMQQSVFQLISAKRNEFFVKRQEIEALRRFWRAHVGFQTLMSGKLLKSLTSAPDQSTGKTSVVAEQGEH